MRRSISKRVRVQAALICAMAASNTVGIHDAVRWLRGDVLPDAPGSDAVSDREKGRREAAEFLATTGSRYHRVRQHNGRGHMIIRQDAIGSSEAMVIAVDLSDADAREALAAYRREEAVGHAKARP